LTSNSLFSVNEIRPNGTSNALCTHLDPLPISPLHQAKIKHNVIPQAKYLYAYCPDGLFAALSTRQNPFQTHLLWQIGYEQGLYPVVYGE